MLSSNFLLNDWLIQVSLGRISRGQETIHLEPQVMKVLVYLASNPGEVVSKQQLISDLWNGAVVNDPALTRCISQIRQALGDCPKIPRFVETIPKVGYRLVAQVGRPAPDRLLARWPRLLAAGIAVAAITTALVTNNGLPTKASVPTVDIRATESSSDVITDYSFAARLFSREISNGLSLLEDLVVIEPDERPRHDPNNHVSDYRLESSLEKQGQHTIFSSRLVDNSSNRAVWDGEYSLNDTDLFSIRAEVARQIAQLFAFEISENSLEKLSYSPTASIVAYDAYLRGRDHYAQYDQRHNELAIAMFEEAIEIDPDFGLAFAGLSDALSQQAIHWSGIRLEEAKTAAYRAVDLESSQAESHKALGLALHASRDREGALRAYKHALALDSDHWQAAYNIGTILVNGSEPQQAETYFLQALRVVPTHTGLMSRLGSMYLVLGDVGQARLWLERALEHSPLQLVAVSDRARLDVLTGRTRAAFVRCDRVIKAVGDDLDCLRVMATAMLIDHDLPGAYALYDRIIRRWPDDDYSRLGKAQTLIAMNEDDRAQQLLQHVVQDAHGKVASGNHTWRDYWMLGAADAIVGNQDAAFQWLEETASAGYRFYLWDAVEPAFTTLRDDRRFDTYLSAVESGVLKE